MSLKCDMMCGQDAVPLPVKMHYAAADVNLSALGSRHMT